MDFRFNSTMLFGDSDILVNDDETCAIEESEGLVGGEGTVIIFSNLLFSLFSYFNLFVSVTLIRKFFMKINDKIG